MAVFFTSLLPQFGTGYGELLGLGLVFSTLTLAWLSAYALAVARTSRILVRGCVRRALDALSGIALASLGIRLAAES
jgi:threonine/homoserine/homoserine lactone efflux protein